MGGVVSTGQDNDDLIDNLKEAEYIKTAKVEQVFRIVDRAHYYLPESRDSAYKDLAWKSGTLHLSAPCIYSEVMEALELEEGLSFLNLGSGTGYLNTMVGFMIGPFGINHGIELHADNVKYAEERLKEFKEVAKKFNDLEFCEPLFVQGNCLSMAPDNRRYDRVYCGAACPPDLKSTIQNLIKLNGILVMPVGDQLLKVRRISETEFTADNVLPVSFASLYVPPTSKEPVDVIVMPDVNPVSLQNQCATVVRNSIRRNFCFELPSSKDGSSKQKKLQATKLFQPQNVRLPLNFLPTAQRLMIMGAFGQSDDSNNSDEDEQTDESYLDLQLQRHAQVRHRVEERWRRERNKGNTEEVDSSLSDDEMNGVEEQRIKTTAKNSTENHLKSVSEDVESMESEDGIVADDEDEEDDECDVKLNGLSYSLGKKKRSGRGSHPHLERELELAGCSSSSEYVAKNSETNISKPDSALSSDEEDLALAISSGPIQVLTSAYHQRYMASYSTSADASETSGFGSLGDDHFYNGSLHSNSVFLDRDDQQEGDITDETRFDTGVCTSGRKCGENSQKSPLLKSSGCTKQTLNPQKDETIEEEVMDENGNDDIEKQSVDDPHISTDEEDVSSSEEEGNVCEGKVKHSLSVPRGPDFTAYLKKQVDTLPIPNTLKLFILRFR